MLRQQPVKMQSCMQTTQTMRSISIVLDPVSGFITNEFTLQQSRLLKMHIVIHRAMHQQVPAIVMFYVFQPTRSQ